MPKRTQVIQETCNSCEKIDNTRFWKWEEHPIPDNPTAINSINTPTPMVTNPDLSPTQMPNPIINIQNAPNVLRFSGLLDCGAGLGRSPEKHSKKAIALVKTLLFCHLCHSKYKQNEMFTKNAFCCWVGADYAASPHTAQKSTPTDNLFTFLPFLT